ncbi:hypothetical protein [Geminicoccus flavidas]|nr:hypothetical protein [Geminicoccus flavidas]
MAAFGRALLVILIAAVLGGIAFLMFWDVPAPRQPVEAVVPAERLAQ